MRRPRLLYLLVAVLVIIMGLASRKYAAALPPLFAAYAGDTLWAVMVFVAIVVVAAHWPPGRVALATLLVSYGVETSQLYHGPLIDRIRNTTPGALVLGQGFLWSDIVCYSAGVMLCVVVEYLGVFRSTR